MRTWNGILATALAGVVLFTSCRKQDMNSALAASPTTQSQKGPDGQDLGAFISYRIATVQSSNNGWLNFNEGSINAIAISLTAMEERGQAVDFVNFEKKLDVPNHSLFSPINLGNLNIPKATYRAFKFAIMMSDDNLNSAMILSGLYTQPPLPPVSTRLPQARPGGPEVVRIIVDQPIQFTGDYAPSLVINRQDYYTMTIAFDPATVMDGISASMLATATRNNGQIIISSAQNARLYNLIIQNLARAMRIQFDVKDPLPSA